MAGVVGAAVYGTTAFFSDSETSTGNVFTAGSVTLAIQEIVHDYFGDDNNAPDFSLTNAGFAFALADLKPLDAGKVTYNLSNGANDAYVCAAVAETANADNGINDPEADAGDVSDGANNGELGDYLSFKFGAFSGTLSSISGQWQSLGTVAANAAQASSLEYCFGEYNGADCVLDEASLYNQAQTDSLNADVQFYAVQTRNNPNFTCASLNDISNDNLYIGDGVNARLSDKWMFYNDTNDTIMTINQFTTDGANEIVSGPVGVGAARMMLHEAAARYNIATFRFKDVKLSDISSIKYRIYDVSDATLTPFVHFNVDFANSDIWQRRLVQVPTGITADTWTEVDALQGGATLWTLSGGNWPIGVSEDGNTPGSTPMTWATILAEYPNAETRSTDSFFGIRVGHPGPANEESYVDWVEFDGVKYDFNN